MGYYFTAVLNATAAALWFFNAGILMATNPGGMWLALFAGVCHAIAAGFNVMAQAIKEARMTEKNLNHEALKDMLAPFELEADTAEELKAQEAPMTTPDPQGLVRCVEISRSDAGGGYIIPLDSLHTHGIFEIECDPEDGVSITFTHCTRTQAELDALPEFNGW